jgi:hypothetical protein
MSEIAQGCAPFEADLSALLDGELDAPRAADVQAHADSCHDCARRLTALRSVDGELRRVAAVPVDPARLDAMRSALATSFRAEPRSAARAPIAARTAPPRRRHWLPPAALAATAAAAAMLLLTLRPDAPVVAPVVAPAREAVVSHEITGKLRADAEAVARELDAGIQKPIGASTPDEELAPAAPERAPARSVPMPWASTLAELPPQTGEKLLVALEALPPDERTRLLSNLIHRKQISPEQRSELRAALARLAVLTQEEQDLLLR